MATLVLDLDGVVILGHPDGGRWDKNIECDLGMDPKRLGHFFRTHFPAVVLGEADLLETLERVWPELECPEDHRSFVDYWFAKDSRLNTEVLDQVDTWRAGGHKAYLATVQEHHRATHIWNVLGLNGHFDDILYSAALGAKKPDPDFFKRAIARLPVTSPDEILFLDDKEENVAAANAMNWRAFHYSIPNDLRKAIASL